MKMRAEKLSAHDRDKVIALLKSIAAECDNSADDPWRRCRHCRALVEAHRRDIRVLIGRFARECSA